MAMSNRKEDPVREDLIGKAKRKKVLHLDMPVGYTKVTMASPFAIRESYNFIRTNLLFALASQKSNVVVFSSALPGEGKSTTCSNMAITMAQTGASVILLDADLRKPVQNRIFKTPNNKGLSKLLGGFYPLEEVLYKDVEEGLDFIPSGVIPPNPSELLGSDNMRLLIEKLDEVYDYVFVDAPPVNLVSDALVLSKFAAGMVLVTRQGYCSYNELQQAVDRVKFTESNILGVVINGTKSKRGRYGSTSYRSYKYEHVED